MSATRQAECWCGEQHRWGPMEVALCDSDGIVRRGAMHRGTDYECTGSAHWSGFHIRCTSPAHVPAGVPVTGAAPDRRQDQRAMFTSAEPAEVCPHGHRHLPPVLDRSCWPPVSPVPDQQREAVADELARHTDTLSYTRDDDTVRLGCRCGHDRGTVTKRELAADLDGRMRAHRLHVADAVIAVLGGEDSRLGADALKDALRGYMLDRCPTWTESFAAGDGLVLGLADAVTVAAQFIESRALNGPQSPPSHAGRAEGGGRMYSGGPSVELSSQDETEGRR